MNKNLSSVALIPARCGSKRIKDKNIKLLNEHPLIAYTISAAINSGIFEDIIVSTDSVVYKEIAEYYGASILSLRPKEYSGDNSPDIDWIRYTLNELETKGKKYDLFSILRPSSPFRRSETIKRALNAFLEFEGADSIRAVEMCSQHPAKMWYVKEKNMTPVLVGDNNGVPWHSCQFISLPEIYVQNASLEIAKTSVIFEKDSISGDIIIPFITEGYEGFDINHPYDWEYATYLINQKMAQLPLVQNPTSEINR